MNRISWITATGFALLVVSATITQACKVPVFRYALERWPADNYGIVAVVNGERDQATAKAIAALQSLAKSDANITTEIIDLAKLTEAELWQVEGLENTDQTPLLQVFYPERDGQRRICWTGELTPDNVNAWIDSPLRSQIVTEIQSGVSAVWVLVEGPDDAQNAHLFGELESSLAEAMKTISIPDGVIDRKTAGSYLKDHPGSSMDDVLRCDIPLQIKFTALRLKRDNADETAFRAMVSGWTEQVETPFVFPIFGRGRMIEPLTADAFEQSSVIAACRYLVGECSCSVKALNPGVDLILKTNWQAILGDQIVMVAAADVALPTELTIPPGRPGATEPTTAPMQSTTEITSSNKSGGNAKYWFLALMAAGVVTMLIKRLVA